MIRSLLMVTLAATASRAEGPEVAVIGHGSIHVAALWDGSVFGETRSILDTKKNFFRGHYVRRCGLPPAEIERITAVSFQIADAGNEVVPSLLQVLVPRRPLNVDALIKSLNRPVATPRGHVAGLPEFVILDGLPNRLAVSPRAVVVLPNLETAELRLAAEPSMIAKALARDVEGAAKLAKQKLVVHMTFDVNEFLRDAENGFDEDAFVLPPALAPALRARVATVTASLPGSLLSVRAELHFPSTLEALAAKPAVVLAQRQLQRHLESIEEGAVDSNRAPLHAFAADLLAGSAVAVKESTLTMTATRELTTTVATAAAVALAAMENAAAKSQSQDNLRTLVLAAHNDINVNEGGLLENFCDAQGRPLLSWRVRLLPHMDQDALFKEFRLDEAWDSEHNRKLIAKMPKTFSTPTAVEAKAGATFYQTFIGRKGAATRPVLQDGDAAGLGINAITDGTTNTIAIVEAADAVPWTKPDDLPFDADAKLPRLGGHFEGGFNIALCDGSVKFVKTPTSEAKLKAAITANGGETLTLDE